MRLVMRLAACTGLAVLFAACGGTNTVAPSPAAPTPPPPITNGGPSFPTGSLTVSGVVTEAGQPLSGVNVNGWVDTNTVGYSYGYAHGPTLTDANGGYRLSGLPAGARFWLQTHKDGYVQQCAQPQLFLQSDVVINAQLVSKARLSSGPAPSASGLRTVSGVVVESTSDGKRPVANVFVDFEPIDDFPAATSYTDANGQFSLCGLPLDSSVEFGAGLGNRVTYVSVAPGQTTIEITLP